MNRISRLLQNRKMRKIEKRTQEQMERARDALLDLTPLEAYTVFQRYCVSTVINLKTIKTIVKTKSLKGTYSELEAAMDIACDNAQEFIDGLDKLNTRLDKHFQDLGFDVDCIYEMYSPTFIDYMVSQHGV
jgi:hypothetical protein